jgi:Fe-S-cluster containining protein
MPVEIKASDLVRLEIATEDEITGSVKKLVKRLSKEGIIQSYRHGTEFFMLTQKANNDCLFLDSVTRLCTVYEKRPDTCRQFPAIGPRPGYCPCVKTSKL